MERAMKIIINGRFLTQNTTGVQRFAYQTLIELDQHVDHLDIELVYPQKVIRQIELKNINKKVLGKKVGHFWEQFELCKYVKKEKALLVNLCNTAPILNPGIIVLHDVSFKVNPSYFSLKFRLWYDIMMKLAVKNAKKVLTVSEFSKNEIIRVYNIDKEKIAVVVNGWEHLKDIEPDEKILNKYEIEAKNFFLAVSSLNPNKNFELILKAAAELPNENFVIAGKFNKEVFGSLDIDFNLIKNIKHVGYVDDNELKALYKNAKAFIFPSFYEGFGIPPLEAIACGTNAIISNTSCLPGIFGNSVNYINPNDYNTLVDTINNFEQKNKKDILEKYTWAENSKRVFRIITEILEKDIK